MAAQLRALKDDQARREAIALHNRSILVEAGAGSGKTAILAGRIAAMLAEGVAPNSIAAVTFTELAASELFSRVTDFVLRLSTGEIPADLRIAFPGGISESQSGHLAEARIKLDEIVCSTIHGFCQRLIKPYPAESEIDPGANVMDRDEADLMFVDIVDDWLHDRLSGTQAAALTELVLHAPIEAVGIVRKIAENLRRHPDLVPPEVESIGESITNFRDNAGRFAALMPANGSEPETVLMAHQFLEMAALLPDAASCATAAGIVHVLTSSPHPDLCTKAGDFKAYKKLGKWRDAAKGAGMPKAEGERLNDEATNCYLECCKAWASLRQAAAGQVLAMLIEETRPIIALYRDHKRSSARLDFDDLIFSARNLLRSHDAVRRALGRRFAHVLVDEFQDTDQLQTEIFWRLCSDDSGDDWRQFRIRSGALFMVGDPKQAIYRFRGADVHAYLQARESVGTAEPQNILSISTNFRSCSSILSFVNEHFSTALSAPKQPGFTPLDAYYEDRQAPHVAAVDVILTGECAEPTVGEHRDAEAEAVADLCVRLIGNRMIVDRRDGEERLCRPGDIALLAPTGAELWRYEEAFERRSIPVSTQAGKGLFRRQEIQDLIALTRVLADRRDTLALGALLRGPLVGLTEEDLLDIVWSFPRSKEEPHKIPRLNLGLAAESIEHPLAREIMKRLQFLVRRSNSTTPHELLSLSVDVMRVRALLLERHRGHAERALANIDLYLNMSKSYAVRGLRAFSEAMTAAWADEARAVEGRPDALEESVTLFTMHAAKGLEWPIVIPINTMIGVMPSDTAVLDRVTSRFYCPVLGIRPAGYDVARNLEEEELNRERVRLWYVATTRARELLILPRANVDPQQSAWIGLVDLSLSQLKNLDIPDLSREFDTENTTLTNLQTHQIFNAQSDGIAAQKTRLTWLAPSRDENPAGEILQEEHVEIWKISDDNSQRPDLSPASHLKGSRERGLVLHKLMEEVLTGETEPTEASLIARARDLVGALGLPDHDDAGEGMSSKEIAGCVSRTLNLREIAAIRHSLLAEVPVYDSRVVNAQERVTAGVVDALTVDSDGRPEVVVDWKSDVSADETTIERYRAQVRAYKAMTGAKRGLVVLMTPGTVISV